MRKLDTWSNGSAKVSESLMSRRLFVLSQMFEQHEIQQDCNYILSILGTRKKQKWLVLLRYTFVIICGDVGQLPLSPDHQPPIDGFSIGFAHCRLLNSHWQTGADFKQERERDIAFRFRCLKIVWCIATFIYIYDNLCMLLVPQE